MKLKIHGPGLIFDPRIGVPEYPGHPEIVGYLDT